MASTTRAFMRLRKASPMSRLRPDTRNGIDASLAGAATGKSSPSQELWWLPRGVNDKQARSAGFPGRVFYGAAVSNRLGSDPRGDARAMRPQVASAVIV